MMSVPDESSMHNGYKYARGEQYIIHMYLIEKSHFLINDKPFPPSWCTCGPGMTVLLVVLLGLLVTLAFKKERLAQDNKNTNQEQQESDDARYS